MISEPSSQLAEGTVLGDYRVEAALAHGGMGAVYRATQISVGRPVALKLLASHLVDDEAFRARFERESRIAISIEHPHVVPVYAVGDVDGMLFIAMRLIDGADLGRIIAREAPLNTDRTLALLAQIASGLDAAHRSGLVHRDVKPGNVVVEELGPGHEHCYLVDFGLAKGGGSGQLTRTGQVLATLDYAPPELLTGDTVDARGDVYSLGVLLFHALTGQTPFSRSHEASALFAQLHAPPPRVSDSRADLPRGLDAVIARALRRDPERRFGSAGELAAAARESIARPRASGTMPRATVGLTAGGPPARETQGASSGSALSGSSVASASHNLPARASSFVGRQRELEQLDELLERSRLVTLIGPGGVGKTRLALQIAAHQIDEQLDGVWFVDLAVVAQADEVARAVAQVLGVREAPDRSLLDGLLEALQGRSLMLLLDNCEHVVEAAADLAATLIQACPEIQLLATSREPLALSDEQLYRVPPLGVPEELSDVDALSRNDAVRLLVERASRQRPEFALSASNGPALASICRRLDGIPLAIELAAARLASLSPIDLDSRLGQQLEVLSSTSRDAPARQQTLQALIDWSWQLLTPSERRVLARLSVFSGSFDIAAAEALAGEAGSQVLRDIRSLVDKSLLQVAEADQETRYGLLQTVREHAGMRLREDGGEKAARGAHRAHYLDLAEAARPYLHSGEARSWMARLEREHKNLHAAIASSVSDADPLCGLRLVVAVHRFWGMRGNALELVQAADSLLEMTREQQPTILRAHALNAVAYLSCSILGDYAGACARGEEALLTARSLADEEAAAEALWNLAWIHGLRGEHSARSRLLEEAFALAGPEGNPDLRARLLKQRAWVAEELGDTLSAREDYETSLRLLQQLGDLEAVAASENDLANLSVVQGRHAEARERLARSVAISRELGDEATLAISKVILGLVEYLDGDPHNARLAYADSFVLAGRLADPATSGYALLGLALAEAVVGEPTRAALLHGAADALFERIEHPLGPTN